MAQNKASNFDYMTLLNFASSCLQNKNVLKLTACVLYKLLTKIVVFGRFLKYGLLYESKETSLFGAHGVKKVQYFRNLMYYFIEASLENDFGPFHIGGKIVL